MKKGKKMKIAKYRDSLEDMRSNLRGRIPTCERRAGRPSPGRRLVLALVVLSALNLII